MDSAGRNFLALAGVSVTFVAYGLCGFVAYAAIPSAAGRNASDGLVVACLLPLLGLAVLLAVSIGLAARDLWRYAAASRRLSRRIGVSAASPTPRLRAAEKLAELDGRVVLVDSDQPFSFVYGALVPRVAISRRLVESLSEEELRATLEHERYHVRNLDPLRSLVGGALSKALFLFPLLEVLRERYEIARELAADRRAAEVCGPRPLAGALLKALEGPRWGEPEVSASLAGPEPLASRLSQLETGRVPKLATADLSSLIWSALGVGAFAFLFVRPTHLFDDVVLCVSPVLVAVAGAYWRLARNASRPL